jgi:hypothetical protein
MPPFVTSWIGSSPARQFVCSFLAGLAASGNQNGRLATMLLGSTAFLGTRWWKRAATGAVDRLDHSLLLWSHRY